MAWVLDTCNIMIKLFWNRGAVKTNIESDSVNVWECFFPLASERKESNRHVKKYDSMPEEKCL
jgi:hypothetical protein